MVEPPARSPSPALPLPPRRSGMVRALLVLSMLFLPLGLTLPVLETTRLWVFKESYSLIDAVRALFEAGEIALAMLIALFSLVTPALKLIAVTYSTSARRPTPRPPCPAGSSVWANGRSPMFWWSPSSSSCGAERDCNWRSNPVSGSSPPAPS